MRFELRDTILRPAHGDEPGRAIAPRPPADPAAVRAGAAELVAAAVVAYEAAAARLDRFEAGGDDTLYSLVCDACVEASGRLVRAILAFGGRAEGAAVYRAEKRLHRPCGVATRDRVYLALPDPNRNALAEGQADAGGLDVMLLFAIDRADVADLDAKGGAL